MAEDSLLIRTSCADHKNLSSLDLEISVLSEVTTFP